MGEKIKKGDEEEKEGKGERREIEKGERHTVPEMVSSPTEKTLMFGIEKRNREGG